MILYLTENYINVADKYAVPTMNVRVIPETVEKKSPLTKGELKGVVGPSLSKKWKRESNYITIYCCRVDKAVTMETTPAAKAAPPFLRGINLPRKGRSVSGYDSLRFRGGIYQY